MSLQLKTSRLGNLEMLPTSESTVVNDATDGGDKITPSGELNVKIGPPLSFYFGFGTLLVFRRLLSFCVFQCIFR